MRFNCIILVVFILALFFGISSAQAAEKQWSGQGDGTNWQDYLNWFPDAVPVAADNVSIDASGASVSASKTFSAKTLTVGTRYDSTFTSEDFIYGTLAPDANTTNALSIGKEGTVVLKGPGTITLKGPLYLSQSSTVSESGFMFIIE